MFWPEIIFPQTQVFGNDGKFHFPENSFLLTEIFTFDPEMIFYPHFHFKSFPKREREKERTESPDSPDWRERERRESPDRRAPIIDRATRQSTSDAIVRQAARSTSGAIVQRARSSIDEWCDRSRLTARSHRSSITIVDRRRSSIDERCDRSRSTM